MITYGTKMNARERLFRKIFQEHDYVSMNRPSPPHNDLTHISTELKLLQIDLVIKF